MNKTNISALVLDSTVYCEEFDGFFDTVLCDAPCSGSGVMKDNPDIKLHRTLKGVEELKDLQLKILSNVSKYVKSGGELIYSTCSVLNEENDALVENFLKSNGDFAVCDTTCELNHIKTNYGLQFLPHISNGAGFYVSKMKKL